MMFLKIILPFDLVSLHKKKIKFSIKDFFIFCAMCSYHVFSPLNFKVTFVLNWYMVPAPGLLFALNEICFLSNDVKEKT